MKKACKVQRARTDKCEAQNEASVSPPSGLGVQKALTLSGGHENGGEDSTERLISRSSVSRMDLLSFPRWPGQSGYLQAIRYALRYVGAQQVRPRAQE